MKDKVARYLNEKPGGLLLRGIRCDDLASLVAGVKGVIYATVMGPEDARATDELCADLKLKKVVLGEKTLAYEKRSATTEILIGRSGAALERARKAYSNVVSEEWGLALDYPECCVRAYVAWRRSPARADLVAHTLRRTPGGRLLPFTLNNVFNYYSRLFEKNDPALYRKFSAMNSDFDRDPVIPWHPCSYLCPASVEAGRRIYAVLAEYTPYTAARRRECLGRPLVFVDKYRYAPLNGECRAAGGGFEVSYRGLAQPVSLLERRLARAIGSASRLKASASGALSFDKSVRLPPGSVLLPFYACGAGAL